MKAVAHSARVARAILITVFLSAGVSGAAFAQTEQDRLDCFSEGTKDYENPSFYDIGLAACERFIRSGRYSGSNLAQYVRSKAGWLHRKKNLDAALREYAYAIQLNPNDVYAYDYRADVFLEQNQIEMAIEDYNRAIRINPNYPAAYYSRGSAYERLGRLEDAKNSYRQALAIPANDRIAEWAHNAARKRLNELR